MDRSPPPQDRAATLLPHAWSYAERLTDSERLALALAGRFRPRERITVWSPNTPEWVTMEFACALAGIVIVTANPALQGHRQCPGYRQSAVRAMHGVVSPRRNIRHTGSCKRICFVPCSGQKA